MNSEIKEYIEKIKNKYSFEDIKRNLDSFKDLNVLIIGDFIVDSYVYVKPKGRAVKDPILSASFVSREDQAGGILAVARHLSTFVRRVKILTLIGEQNSYLSFIQRSLSYNMELKMFEKINSPTIVKERFIDHVRNEKLFKIEYLNDYPLDETLTKEIIDYLDNELPRYDLVLIADFGHGFLNEKIRRKIEEKSKFLALNVQSNSSNMGYNYFNVYNRFDYISLDESELRLPLYRRFEDIFLVIEEALKKYEFKNLLVTRGKKGCIFVNELGELSISPALTENVKDTVGAGDAVFSITSLFSYNKIEKELITFISNCAGAIKVKYPGNKEAVTKEKLLVFIEELYSNSLLCNSGLTN